ncbi:MAG: type restriction enzyme subunit [Actinomycetota bacterium]|nr:type restriction enzyme subunit [Actinomycetota bacterium]
MVSQAEYRRPAVVLSSIGARCGKCFLAEGEWTSLANTQLILPDLDRVDPRFLWYQLDDESRWHRSGTGQPFIKPSDVKSHQVWMPPLDEQRRIAAILDQADALQQSRQKLLAAIPELTASLFAEMYYSERTDWVEFGEALSTAEVFTDGDWVESKDQDPQGGVRLTQLADVGDGIWLNRSSRFLTVEKAKELRCTFLAADDILVARMPDPLGRACIFPGDVRPCVTVVDVCVIRPDPRVHEPTWLMAAINSAKFRTQLAQFATGTTRSRISRRNLGKLFIPDVPVTEQRRFADAVGQIKQFEDSALRASRRYDELRSSLRATAFAGQL